MPSPNVPSPNEVPHPGLDELVRRLEALESLTAASVPPPRDAPRTAAALDADPAQRRDHQKLLIRVARSLLATTGAEFSAAVRAALREAGKMLGLDHAALYWTEGDRSHSSEGWNRDAAVRLPSWLSHDGWPWLRSRIDSRDTVRVEAIEETPPEAATLRTFMAGLGIGSLVALPLEGDVRVLGLSIFATRSPRRWRSAEVEDLRLLTDLLAGGTLRERVHERLRSSELRYRNVVEDQTDFIVRWKPDGTRTFVNGSYCRAFGITEEEAIGTSFFPLITPGDRRTVRERLAALTPRDPVSTAEHRVSLPDGSVGWQRWTDRAVFDAAGTLVEMQSVGRDITARKAAEQALERANAELRALQERVLAENVYLREEIHLAHGGGEIVGSSEPLRRCLLDIERVAPTASTVLILGETGTGKELVARRIHALSPRHDGPLISVNCAALPAPLAESELFGHERGAFTGAERRRAGRFELADRGTLFLDEVGDLPPELQAKLLRAIQDGRFERVGGSETIQVDVRVVAATHRDLEAAVANGSFRQDLFYRLSVFPIRVPPLRERREDIPELALHFVGKHARRLGRTVDAVSSRTLDRLARGDWPGNVRELENWIERALITATGPVLDVTAEEEGAGSMSERAPRAGVSRLSDVVRDHVLGVLEERKWIIEGPGGAAAALGLRPSTLRSRLKKLGIVRRKA